MTARTTPDQFLGMRCLAGHRPQSHDPQAKAPYLQNPAFACHAPRLRAGDGPRCPVPTVPIPAFRRLKCQDGVPPYQELFKKPKPKSLSTIPVSRTAAAD